jgi:hypothetical protein
MAQQNRDDSMPNRSSEMEQAEGSRETVRNSGDQGGGITNRSLERELEEQRSVPERGRSQSDSSMTDESESER